MVNQNAMMTIFANSVDLANQIRYAARHAIERKCAVVWNKERRDVYATNAKDDDNILLLDFAGDPTGIYTKLDFGDADILIAVSLIDQFDAKGLSETLRGDKK